MNLQYVANSTGIAPQPTAQESADVLVRNLVSQLEFALQKCNEMDPAPATPAVGNDPHIPGLVESILIATDLSASLNARITRIAEIVGRL